MTDQVESWRLCLPQASVGSDCGFERGSLSITITIAPQAHCFEHEAGRDWGVAVDEEVEMGVGLGSL